jgi:hypothetical protein
MSDVYEQQKVYNYYKKSVRTVVEGYNQIIFAYGESGSGKTYSLLGSEWEKSIKNQALNIKKAL